MQDYFIIIIIMILTHRPRACYWGITILEMLALLLLFLENNSFDSRSWGHPSWLKSPSPTPGWLWSNTENDKFLLKPWHFCRSQSFSHRFYTIEEVSLNKLISFSSLDLHTKARFYHQIALICKSSYCGHVDFDAGNGVGNMIFMLCFMNISTFERIYLGDKDVLYL